MTSRLRPARGRRMVAAVVTAVVAVGGGVSRMAVPASAAETRVETRTSCLLGGAVPVSFTADHEPEVAVTGEPVAIHVQTDFRMAAGTPTVPVRTLDVTVPVPAGVSVGDIGVAGGTFTKASQETLGATVVVHLRADPDATTTSLQLPELTIPVRIAAGWAGATLTFAVPSKLAVGIDLSGTALTETCTTIADSPALLSIRAAAPTPPGTGGGDEETTVQTTVGCSITGSWPVVYHVSHEPVEAVAGEPLKLHVRTTLGLPAGTPDLAITSLTIVLPPPSGGASIGDITVTGGSFTKFNQISQDADGPATRLNLVANTGVTTSGIQVPDLDIPLGLPPEAAGQTITVAPPTVIAISAQLNSFGLTESCGSITADAPLLTITPAAPTPPSTTSTTRPGHGHPGTRPNPPGRHGGGHGHPQPRPPAGPHGTLLDLINRIVCEVFDLC